MQLYSISHVHGHQNLFDGLAVLVLVSAVATSTMRNDTLMTLHGTTAKSLQNSSLVTT